MKKRRPGEVRDAVFNALAALPDGATLREIEARVEAALGPVASSSVRSYLRLNTPELFYRVGRARYALREQAFLNLEAPQRPTAIETVEIGKSRLVLDDCVSWFHSQQPNSFHGVVTDPPYGLFEYSPEQQEKLRAGKGGIWRIPPSFDGSKRSPLPRFTVLSERDIRELQEFFFRWARALWPVLVPGAHVIIATNPLLSYAVAGSVVSAGFERRGEIVRLVTTMRGGDRPKAAHDE